jgi:TATA-box binding protein (TBP) (component of TFIID and TFIIIB)
MIFKEGKMVERIVGARSAQEFKSVIDKYLS